MYDRRMKLLRNPSYEMYDEDENGLMLGDSMFSETVRENIPGMEKDAGPEDSFSCYP
jgi:hypothetical protein